MFSQYFPLTFRRVWRTERWEKEFRKRPAKVSRRLSARDRRLSAFLFFRHAVLCPPPSRGEIIKERITSVEKIAAYVAKQDG